jgi:hypothetical protein
MPVSNPFTSVARLPASKCRFPALPHAPASKCRCPALPHRWLLPASKCWFPAGQTPTRVIAYHMISYSVIAYHMTTRVITVLARVNGVCVGTVCDNLKQAW